MSIATESTINPQLPLDGSTASFFPSGSFSIGKEPDWVRERPVPWEAPHSEGDHDYLLLSDSQRSFSQKTIYERNVRRLITLEAIQRQSHLEIEFDPHLEHLVVHDIRIWRDNESRSVLDPGRFIFRQRERGLEDQIIHGKVSAILIIEDVRPNDIVETRYSLITRQELAGVKMDEAFWLQPRVCTAAWYVSVHVPKTEIPYYQQSDGNRMEPETLETESEYIWTWSGSQSKKIQQEVGVPVSESFPLRAQLSGYESWAEVSRIIAENWVPICAEAQEAKAWVSEICSPEDSLETSALKIIQWVQDNVRYMGMEAGLGGLLPSSPDDVLRRRYGDCKGKSILLCALLNAINVEAHPVLVNAIRRGGVAGDLPSVYSFNHVIVTFVINGQRGFADATTQSAGGSVWDRCHGDFEKGLCISSKTEDLMEIPWRLAENSKWTVKEHFYIDPQGDKSYLDLSITATGAEANGLRYKVSSLGREAFAQEEASLRKRFFADIHPDPASTFIVTDQRESNRITVEGRFLFQQWGYLVQKKVKVLNYAPLWVGCFLSIPPEYPPRKHSFALRHPGNISYELVMHAPLIPIKEREFETKCPWFVSTTECKMDRNRNGWIIHSFTTKKKSVKASDVREFSKQALKAISSSEFRFVIKNIRGQRPPPFSGRTAAPVTRGPRKPIPVFAPLADPSSEEQTESTGDSKDGKKSSSLLKRLRFFGVNGKK